MNKKGFEFSFGWLFAIIVGAVIIFLAIYGTSKLIKVSENVQDTAAAKELGTLLNPTESGFDSGKQSKIKLTIDTRVYNGCTNKTVFGEQKISISTKSKLASGWSDAGLNSTFYNKYIFSSDIIEGKELTVFSKSFRFPFKIADILIIWSDKDKFCFISPPTEIEDEVNALNLTGVQVKSTKSECPKTAMKVCFGENDCDVNVDISSKAVSKKNLINYYVEDEDNALLYAAIFSSPGVYECQVSRLMKRASEVASLLAAKTVYLSAKGCPSNTETELGIYSQQISSFKGSQDLRDLSYIAREIGDKNEKLNCKLY